MGLVLLLVIAATLVLALATAAVVRSLRRPPRKTWARALARGLATDPAELGLEARERTFRLPDGSTTPGWVIAGKQADGPRVVIIHGFADSRYGALTWLERVIDHAADVVVFDLPGHGEATAALTGLGTREPADVLAIVDELSVEGPTRPAVLYGYSLGASIAIGAAALDAQREHHAVAGVIADGPYARWHEPVYRTLRRRRYPAALLTTLTGLVFRVTLPGLRHIDRVRDAAATRCPLLVLHGCRDEICPLASAQRIAEAAPRGRLVTFDEGCHLDLAVCEPERYQHAVAALFAQAAAAGPGRASPPAG